MQQLYQQIILDHSKNPIGAGLALEYDTQVRHVNPTCGDEILLRARVRDGVVTQISHDAQGCSISVASASVMTDLVSGQSVQSALERYDAMLAMLQTRDGTEPDEDVLGDAVAFSGVAKFPARVKCALLPWVAMKEAVIEAQAGPGTGNPPPTETDSPPSPGGDAS
ncbi:MAG: SUF system NifU family Fe-S cluster assembly protein [Micrococcales bacterium]|nr:MAG: SUF system NifU family Fe-S cluster assembly protein [Micrococcales bacterium]PIE26022.1 MAG: SUF system NifU family Fe-S cluster assembly protein [Micrococcales bacterium]